MNFFKNFFGRGNGEVSESVNLQELAVNGIGEQDITNINKNLFSDEGAAEKKFSEGNGKIRSEITEYLERDFEKDGYNDGYDDPSGELKEAMMEKIKSDYIFLIDKKISDLNLKIMNLQEDSICIAGIAVTDVNLIESRITELRKLILRLIEEKEYANDNKGSVIKALNNYSVGFNRGVSDFTKEKIIASSTGMF